MKVIWCVVITFTACLYGASVRAGTCSDYGKVCDFVQELKIESQNIVESGKKNAHALLETAIERFLDLQSMAKFVIGSNWKTATPSQREKFVQVYSKYVAKIYATQLYSYVHHEMRIISVSSVDAESYSVKVRLVGMEDREDFTNADFRLIERNGSLLIDDIRVNNSISVAVSQRSMVRDLIRKKGIDGAISHFVTEVARRR